MQRKQTKLDRVAELWVKWNMGQIPADDVMVELRKLFPKKIHDAWMRANKEGGLGHGHV